MLQHIADAHDPALPPDADQTGDIDLRMGEDDFLFLPRVKRDRYERPTPVGLFKAIGNILLRLDRERIEAAIVAHVIGGKVVPARLA